MSSISRLEILRRTSLLLTGALTVLDAAYVIPVNGSHRRLSGIEYARAHREIVKVAGPTAPVIAVPLIITNVMLLSRMRGERGFGWVIASLLCLLVNAGITFAVNVPINDEFTRAADDSPPEDWESLRDRWAAAHNARTFAQVVGLPTLLIGLKKSDGTKTERK